MPLLSFCGNVLVSGALVTGLASVGIAAVGVRTAIGVYEFEKCIVLGIREFVHSRGDSLPSHPKYPKPDLTPFLLETSELDVETEAVVEDSTELVEVTKKDEEGKTVVVSSKRIVNRHQRAPFTRLIAIEAKNHFGGQIAMSKANYLAVGKFLTGKCKERGVVPAHTRSLVAAAMAIVFTPDIAEIRMQAALNSHIAYKRRIALEAELSPPGWRRRLITGFLNADNWEELWYVLNGRSPNVAQPFSK